METQKERRVNKVEIKLVKKEIERIEHITIEATKLFAMSVFCVAMIFLKNK